LASSSPGSDLAKKWTSLLGVPGEGYWASHADFGRPLSEGDASDAPTALIGKSRAGDMVVNILLPLLLAHAGRRDLPELRETALAVYARYPKLADNHITRAMAEESLGPRKHKAINGARRQQGLIHLYRLYCQTRRCYECPISGLAPRP